MQSAHVIREPVPILTRLPASFSVLFGDCVAIMRRMPEASVDAVVTDPPYGLEFMGKEWDKLGDKSHTHASVERSGLGVPRFGSYMPVADERAIAKLRQHRLVMQAWHEAWAREALRVLKPGGHLLAFGGTRTFHRLTCALEDVGFEIRDCLMWLYGQGFPKSLDVSKAIDKAAGVERTETKPYVAPDGKPRPSVVSDWGYSGERDGKHSRRDAVVSRPVADAAKQWSGWGTALKPAWEPILLARKPLSEPTVAANVLRWGTGAINVDACRTRTADSLGGGKTSGAVKFTNEGWNRPWMDDPAAVAAASERAQAAVERAERLGRWPANVVLSHAEGCEQIGTRRIRAISGTAAGRMAGTKKDDSDVYGKYEGSERAGEPTGYGDSEGRETVEDWRCVEDCPVRLLDEQSGILISRPMPAGTTRKKSKGDGGYHGDFPDVATERGYVGDSGGASRFFYCAKASRSERTAKGSIENSHPTVKPIALMRYLCRLVTPLGGLILDPFVGSGSTLLAAREEGFDAIGCDSSRAYVTLARARLE